MRPCSVGRFGRLPVTRRTTLAIHFGCSFSAVAIRPYSFLPVFFSLPSEFLIGFSAAAGIALVTSVANLGGFVGPYTVGLIRQRTGSSYYGLICAGVFFLISAGLALLLPKRAPPGPDSQPADTGLAFATNPEQTLKHSRMDYEAHS